MRIFPIFLLSFLLVSSFLYAQNAKPEDSVRRVENKDTLRPSFVQQVSEAGKRDQKKSEDAYEAGRTTIRQKEVFAALTRAAQNVKIYLGSGPDAAVISKQIASVKRSFQVVQDGIFINKGTAQTERNLSVSSAILFQLIRETEGTKKQIDKYADDLIGFRHQIDSLLTDPAIYTFPADSLKLMRYLSRLQIVVRAGNPSDNELNEVLEKVQVLQNSLDELLFQLRVAYEKIEAYRNNLANINLKREFNNIWDTVGYTRSFGEILRFSFAKEKLALQFYSQENLFRIFVLVLLIMLLHIVIRSLKRKVEDSDNAGKQLIVRHPLISAILIILSVYQFVFINAPFIFSFCIWMMEVVCLLVLFKGFVTPYWFRFWIVVLILFLAAGLDNFVLQASRTERWIVAGLSIVGIVHASVTLLGAHRRELKERSVIIFVRFLLVAMVLSLILNLFGRYNLSKTLLNAGYTGIVTAILFIWVIRLLNEGLALGGAIYKHPERKLLYLNFNRMGSKAPAILYGVFILGWFVIVGRNFYFFNLISVPFDDFLHKQRTIGDYSFSINGIFLFLLIAFCSMLLSRIISFFAADPHAVHGSVNDKPGKTTVGSWILLIRIFIISLGLFLAFAASGLPLDKLTIVLGALGVGIGLGLQGLVSNLVSGLIIAFERPVNVGDLIEINGKSGTMKSIGFRSSIVTLIDGSCLIVPNGDLLSNHLINWSMGRNNRRVIVAVSVAYGSDLEQVKKILKDIAGQDKRILAYPGADAVARKFNESAIDFELIYWVKMAQEAMDTTSDLIGAIDRSFKEAGIVIPFPQQEIRIKKTGERDL